MIVFLKGEPIFRTGIVDLLRDGWAITGQILLPQGHKEGGKLAAFFSREGLDLTFDLLNTHTT